VLRDKMLNVLNVLKCRRSLQYAAGVTGQFKAGMGQQTSILFKDSVPFDGVYQFLAKIYITK
jgi:hypothetical protein